MNFLQNEIIKIKDVKKILNDIRINPLNHGYPQNIVDQCLNFERNLEFSLNQLSDLTDFKFVSQLKSYNEYISKLYGQVLNDFTKFSKMGWYLSNRFIEDLPIQEVYKVFNDVNRVNLENLIISETEKMMIRIISDCSDRFSNRKHFFTEIKKAYQLEMYNSVVLLCYTQADGICNEILKNGFFDKELKESKLKRKKKKSPQDFHLSAYKKISNFEWNHSISVIEQLGIAENEITAYLKGMIKTDPELTKKSFNRHLVVHGHSLHYGTKLNAVRGLCLLDFLHFIFTEAVEIDMN